MIMMMVVVMIINIMTATLLPLFFIICTSKLNCALIGCGDFEFDNTTPYLVETIDKRSDLVAKTMCNRCSRAWGLQKCNYQLHTLGRREDIDG